MKILIVDDKKEELLLLEIVLKRSEYKVISATNGKEALEKLRTEGADMIIADILMPVMDGFQFCRECKEDEKLKNIPFVFCTATYTDEKDEELALKLGADRFIRKPMEPDEFIKIIQSVIGDTKEKKRREKPVVKEEKEVLKLYSERLVNKLEKKNLELQKLEQRYRNLCENVNDFIFSLNEEGYFTDANCKVEIFGYTVEDIIGKHFTEFLTAESRKKALNYFDKAKKDMSSRDLYEVEVIKKDGSIAITELSMSTLYMDGKFIGRFGIARDITERKRAEKEMEGLQEQLRQSQKIEAIGRLAGGIAHDFNNLLTIIRGYSQLSLLELKEGDPLKGKIEEIVRSTKRAAALTYQLLTFSRRHVMEMRVLDLNAILRDMEKMLHRVIGEDIELVTAFAMDLGRVKTDPGQIEQVIMNLAINARDAMPHGGKLTIESVNVELNEEFTRAHISLNPGHYVMLSVSDTGLGMTSEVREKIFEPFFTTKEKGTGLGLSTVYGIVKQSGGDIWVYSEPGHGTTFKIYLPEVEEPLEVLREEVLEGMPRGNETILIVEDDETVRKLAKQILKTQGYTILEAAGGGEALLICEQQKEPIHLILTDVVMPQLSGNQLIERLRQVRQDFKVVYMSGYTDEAIVHHRVLEKGVTLIRKPFSIEELARKVREALDK